MAGLLAWATDVVSGNGNLPAEHPVRPAFRFTPEQQELVRCLDAQAVALQRALQQLRQRMPPLDSSHSLSHLHTDSLASQSALTMEINAHRATIQRAQNREASLLAENVAYAKAIAAGQQQAKEKGQEANQLQAQLQEMESVEGELRAELECLENLLAEGDCMEQANQQGSEVNEQARSTLVSSADKAYLEAVELQRTRAELKIWEDKLMKVENEWTALQQTSARWPSPAQRENELERRLRSLSEQLVIKQAQTESLASERDALELQLSQASDAHQQLLLGNASGNLKRNKIGRYRPYLGNTLHESKIHTQLEAADARKKVLWREQVGLGSIRHITSPLTWLKSLQSHTIMALRAFAVAYVLGLHVIVFFVISFSG